MSLKTLDGKEKKSLLEQLSFSLVFMFPNDYLHSSEERGYIDLIRDGRDEEAFQTTLELFAPLSNIDISTQQYDIQYSLVRIAHIFYRFFNEVLTDRHIVELAASENGMQLIETMARFSKTRTQEVTLDMYNTRISRARNILTQ